MTDKLNDLAPLVIGGALMLFPRRIGLFLLKSQAKFWGFEINEKTIVRQKFVVMGLGFAFFVTGLPHILGYE